MEVDLDEGDDPDESEVITDPIIRRYAQLLHTLTQELSDETENYPLNQKQINQLIDSLRTVANLLMKAEDLERLDAMLRMSFPWHYFNPHESVVSMLTDYPLSTSN